MPSSIEKKQRVEKSVNLQSFFLKNSDCPTHHQYLVFACSEEGKIMKNVSACHRSKSIENQCECLQSVTRQCKDTILPETSSDKQIESLLYLLLQASK